jgi:cell division protein FtsW
MRPIKARATETDSALIAPDSSSALADAAALGLIGLTILLFGLTMLYSTSFGSVGSTYFKKQLIWGAVGFAGLGFILFVGYKKLSDVSLFIMGGVALLLAIADFLFPAVKGAHRWIMIPHIGNIQPSEMAKLALCLFMAKYCAESSRAIENAPLLKVCIPAGICCAPLIGLVMLGKDLGTTVLLSSVFLFVLFAAGVKLRYILPIPILAGPVLFFLIKNFDKMRWARLTSFMDPESNQVDEGYQLWHSLLALGSGNWLGVGFTESRMKANYLPEAHTDFILSIVGEELGFIALCLVMVAYMAFVYFAVRISSKARTRQGMLLGFGLTCIIAMQSIINIGVVSGAFPTKGMPAPFISYGGSNLVMCLAATGLLLSVAIDAAYPDYCDELTARFKNWLKTLWSGKPG